MIGKLLQPQGAKTARAISIRWLFPLLLGAVCAPTLAQDDGPPPLAVVEARMDALNDHDLTRFLATYAEDVQIFLYPNTPLSSGKKNLSDIFGPLMAARDVEVTVLSMQAAEAYVVVDRVVSYGDVSEPGIAIYEVRDGLIRSVTFLRDSRRAPRVPREP